MPMHEQFLTRSQKHPKVSMQDILPYGGIVIWPFPQLYLIKQKGKEKKGGHSFLLCANLTRESIFL